MSEQVYLKKEDLDGKSYDVVQSLLEGETVKFGDEIRFQKAKPFRVGRHNSISRRFYLPGEGALHGAVAVVAVIFGPITATVTWNTWGQRTPTTTISSCSMSSSRSSADM